MKHLALTLIILTLYACGGGGSGNDTNSDTPTPPTNSSVVGSAVKGPIAGATIRGYALNTSAANLITGAVIVETVSNQFAAIESFDLPSVTILPIILQADGSGATDLNTNTTPAILTMRTLLTSQLLNSGAPIYITPLTTIALEIARQNADSDAGEFNGNNNSQISHAEFEAALPVASALTIAAFGFGMDADINLFTTPPLVTDTTTSTDALSKAAQYRTAIEAVSALLVALETDINNNSATVPNTDELMLALASDIADGAVDGNSFDQAINAFADASNLTTLLDSNVATLMVPNTTILIADIEQLLISETNDTGFENIDTSALMNGGAAEVTPEPIDLNPDSDGDGVIDRDDTAINDNCIPSAFNAVCQRDTDNDNSTDFAEGEFTDSDGDGAPDYTESSLLDEDNDGVNNQLDSANSNACIPQIFIAACTQDSDGDGATDFSEGQTTDTDSDGLFDYQESSIDDGDNDGVADQNDPENTNPCAPEVFVAACLQDSDSDGISDFNEGETSDTDRDGIVDYLESIIVDADNDGSTDQNDPLNDNPCVPNVFVAVCDQDTDGDGVSDFDEGPTTDTDSDGLFDYQESSTLDADNDGTFDQFDPENSNPCVPVAAGSECLPGITSRPPNISCNAPDQVSIVDSGIVLERRMPNITFSTAVKALQAPGDTTHWFVAQKRGELIRVSSADNASSSDTYLSLPVYSEGEAGFLSMAFSPDWPSTKALYVYYTAGTPIVSRLSRLIITDDSTVPVTYTEQIIKTIDQPRDNHNGGDMFFGEDNYLYLSLGDGGGSNDPDGNGQNKTTLLGNMLRIDVEGVSFPSPAYNIPASNPFSANAKCGPTTNANECPEIYASGFRNPWRWSFDKDTNDLWLADVGQDNLEEVNVVTLAGNFGWVCQEGTSSLRPDQCTGEALVDPVHEYPHTAGNVSITGGYVYRGTAIPSMIGQYLFADYVSGRIWSLTGSVNTGFTSNELFDASFFISSFAQDQSGELYVLSFNDGLYQIKAGDTGGTDNIPTILSDFGCVDSSDPTQPSSGLIPYQPNARFWSDNADKLRWLAIPDGSTIDATTIDANGNNIWTYPNGTVTMKNFVVEDKLIETRFFMRHTNGIWAGYTYEWNEAETEATRVIGGKLRDLTHTASAQQWIYPSQGECTQCHTAAAGYVLGANTGQLNGELAYPSGITDNQLETFNHIDLFTQDVAEPVSVLAALPDPSNVGESINARARAYLHTNCASCHQPNGGTPANIDLRFDTDLTQMGICNVDPLLSDLGISNAKIIAPGLPLDSVLLNRMNRRDSNGMPAIGSNLIDTAGVQLIESWINSFSSCP